jgi:hypothetical protein
VDASLAFQATDRVVDLRIDEPEQCRHGRTVTQVWFVLNDDRSTIVAAYRDGEATGEGSPDQRLNEQLIVV